MRYVRKQAVSAGALLLISAAIIPCCVNANCIAGYFDPPQCDQKCHCYFDTVCDENSGRCPFPLGCAKGWSGPKCQERVCPNGTFSPPECSNPCHCKVSYDCDPMSGSCPHFGCSKGWWGPGCSESMSKCKLGTADCVLTSMTRCSCSDPTCKLPPGQCRKRLCPDGWSGANCIVRACPRGRFGPPDCKSPCHCMNNKNCMPIDGNCRGTPCMQGWIGTNCSTRTCSHRRFGVPKCEGFCFCKEQIGCDYETGVCPNDCEKGWIGDKCNIRLCPPDKFGFPKCNKECKCEINSLCNSITGHCECNNSSGPCVHNLIHKHMDEEDSSIITSTPVVLIAIVGAIAFVGVLGIVGYNQASKYPANKRRDGTGRSVNETAL